MLADFIVANRDAIVALTREKRNARSSSRPAEAEQNGIPVFLEQLAEALRVARSSDEVDHEEMLKSAADHGRYLLSMGLTVGQVVLGLTIARKAARASGGDIRVRDLPGKGCVFTLDLPRKPPPPLSVIDGGKNRTSSSGEASGFKASSLSM